MKYIRTKDGKIYELQETKNGEKCLVRNGELIPLWNTEAYEILTQADTIEELCDYFLFDDAFECLNPSIYARASTARDHAKYHGSLIGYIVIEKNGAKALEPVAKTNDEGEFELL